MASLNLLSENICFFRSLGVLQWSVHSLLLQLPVAGELEHKGLDTGMRPQQREVNCFVFRPKQYNNQSYQHKYAFQWDAYRPLIDRIRRGCIQGGSASRGAASRELCIQGVDPLGSVYGGLGRSPWMWSTTWSCDL